MPSNHGAEGAEAIAAAAVAQGLEIVILGMVPFYNPYTSKRLEPKLMQNFDYDEALHHFAHHSGPHSGLRLGYLHQMLRGVIVWTFTVEAAMRNARMDETQLLDACR